MNIPDIYTFRREYRAQCRAAELDPMVLLLADLFRYQDAFELKLREGHTQIYRQPFVSALDVFAGPDTYQVVEPQKADLRINTGVFRESVVAMLGGVVVLSSQDTVHNGRIVRPTNSL